jgi:ribonuclease HII
MGHGGSQGGRFPHAGRKEDATSLHEQKKPLKKTAVTHPNVVELGSTKVTRKQVVETLKAEKDRSQKYLNSGYGCKVTMTASLKQKGITDGRNRTTR